MWKNMKCNKQGTDISLLLIVVMVIPLLLPGPAAATYPPGRIAYADITNGIWIMHGDGSNPVKIINSGSEPVWSPNGQQLTYSASYLSRTEIFIANLDGTNIRRITDNATSSVSNPSWSPDGNKIVFVRSDGKIYRINIDGSNEVCLNVSGTHPCFSPDGTKITFAKTDGIYVMTADGGNQTRLYSGSASDPVWSPDGTKIAFAGSGNPYYINVMSTDGSNLIQIGYYYSRQPAWSPDGTKLVHYKWNTNPYGIAVMSADGSNQVVISSGSHPSWD